MATVSESRLRILIDSNIFIAVEELGPGHDAHSALAADLLARSSRLGYVVVISHGTRRDLLHAPAQLRSLRERQLTRYHVLAPPALDPSLAAQAGFPPSLGANDSADLEVLASLHAGAADWLVTQDRKLLARSVAAGLGSRAFNLEAAIETLTALESSPTAIPTVNMVKGHEVALHAPIFDSLKADYADFAEWWRGKVAREERDVILLGEPADPDGLTVLKFESDSPYALTGRVLKLCTFKVSDDLRGTKRGELLLKAAVDYARRNRADRMYVEVAPGLTMLTSWLSEFGFEPQQSARSAAGDVVLVKELTPLGSPHLDPLAHNIRYGPGSVRFLQGHLVPIRPEWHARLLPEAEAQSTLFGEQEACGNALRKAYLCHAKSRQIRPGDVLLFVLTGGIGSVTSVGVVEDTRVSDDAATIVSFVGRRTVYTASEIEALTDKGDVLAIRFRLDRVLEPPWTRSTIQRNGLVKGWAQTITKVRPGGLAWVRQQLGASP